MKAIKFIDKNVNYIGIALGLFILGLTIFNICVYGVNSTSSFEF